MNSGLGFYDKDIILLFKAIQKHVEWHVWHSEHQWSALFSPDTKRNKFSGQLAELFLPWLRGHGPNHWNIGRRREEGSQDLPGIQKCSRTDLSA